MEVLSERPFFEGVRRAYREGYLEEILLRPFFKEEYGG